jgi:hypothetical protein
MKKALSLKLSLAIALVCAMSCTACSTAWVGSLDAILAAAAPALINILQIVAVANGQPVNSTLAAKINGDATAIETLAADFAKVSSASSQGVCQELQAAVSVYQTDQELVLQAAQVSDVNTQTKIALLTDLVASTLRAITSVIPSCQRAALVQSRTETAYSISGFASRYNSILLDKTGNAAVDALTSQLKLRQHSKVLEIVTFGRIR